jgi:hypothetical protein
LGNRPTSVLIEIPMIAKGLSKLSERALGREQSSR